MSNSGEKLRALVLAALMVFSVFGGTIALTGSVAAAANSVSVGPGAGNVETVGDDVTVNITLDNSNGETVTIENVVNGKVVNSITVTDGDDREDGSQDGTIDLTLTAGKTYGSSSSEIRVTDGDGNTFTNSYTTNNYLVEASVVTHGETTTIEGNISSYPGVTVSGKVNYSLQYDADLGVTGTSDDPTTEVVTSSDTSDGTFVIRRTFDEVDSETTLNPAFLKDYPPNGSTVGSANAPSYIVYVAEAEGTNADDSADGSVEPSDEVNAGNDTILTRLDVSADTDPAPPVYNETVDVINGQVFNATSGAGSYAIRVLDPAGSTAKTTTTAGDGSFAFTLVTDDAAAAADGEDPWKLGTNEGAFINYKNVTVKAQDTNLSLTVPSSARQAVSTTYTVQLNQSTDDEPINTRETGAVDGFVNVTGPFSSVEGSSPTGALVDTGFGTASVIRAANPDTDGDYEYVHINTAANGSASFDATPVDDTQEAELYGDDGTGTNTAGIEVTTDAADTPESPDYVGTDSVNLGVAEPVNIVGLTIEDPHGVNFNTATFADPFPGNTTNIGDDSGPFKVEPLPNNDGAGRLIPGTNSFRLGDDSNRGFNQITVYRVTFSLVDENGVSITNDGVPRGPGVSGDGVEEIRFTGAGINATAENTTSSFSITDNNGGEQNLLAIAHDPGTGPATADGDYVALIRPTRVDEVGETFDITVETTDATVSTGDTRQPDSINTSGLFVERFTADGEEVTEVAANVTTDLSAQIRNPEQTPTFVNNGRVNVTQRQDTGVATGSSDIETRDLNSTDARVSSVNNGSYEFENVQVGPRGLDPDDDGIANDISQLVFTGYQYTDADNDNRLAGYEVNNATVETLELALNRNLNVTFINATTVTGSEEYAGVAADGNFTVTEGVEYGDITFRLTRNGQPVNLSKSPSRFGPEEPTLDELDNAGSPDTSGNYVAVYFGNDPLAVEFEDSESNRTKGIYTIGDIADDPSGVIDSSNAPVQAGDSFVFGDTFNVDNESAFRVFAQTPGATNATDPDEATFDSEEVVVETDIVGVAGDAVPGSDDSADLAHNQTDTFNTSVSDIETPTIGVNRTYRINATVYDALGDTRLNGTAFGEVNVEVSEDDAEDTVGEVPPRDAESDVQIVGGVSGASPAGVTDNNVVDLTDADAQFQYDVDVMDDGDDNNGTFTTYYQAEAQADGALDGSGSAPTGQSNVSATPVAQNPVIQVYGLNGGELPVNESTDNQILANGITQELRIEAFPADQDDFTLRDGLPFSFTNPVAETSVATTTKVNGSVDTVLATPGYDQGQIGFIGSITPTGTGDGIISVFFGTSIATNTTGDPIRFDVLRSNRELDVAGPASVSTGSSATFTFTDASTGDAVSAVTVIVESPNGDTTTLLTDDSGQVTINGSFVDENGEFTITTKRAGYAPSTTTFDGTGVPGPAVQITGATLVPDEVGDNQTVTHTLTLNVSNVSDDGSTDTITVNFPSAVENVALGSASIEDADGDTVAITGASVSGTVATIDVSPDSSADLRDLTATVEVDVTFPDVGANTTANISASVSDSSTGSDSASVPVTIIDEEAAPTLPTIGDATSPPTDPDGDGLPEDIDGDGNFTVFDVQLFLDNFSSDEVQNNADSFDFDDSGSVDVFDVQFLLDELTAS